MTLYNSGLRDDIFLDKELDIFLKREHLIFLGKGHGIISRQRTIYFYKQKGIKT